MWEKKEKSHKRVRVAALDISDTFVTRQTCHKLQALLSKEDTALNNGRKRFLASACGEISSRYQHSLSPLISRTSPFPQQLFYAPETFRINFLQMPFRPFQAESQEEALNVHKNEFECTPMEVRW